MTGQKVTENGNDSAVRDVVAETLNLDPRDHVRDDRIYVGPRWGISVSDLHRVIVYGSEDEARAHMPLAQMDVPAVLVVDDGNGWMVAE